jgi:PmbA protein
LTGKAYEELASSVVKMALDKGATGAECTISEGSEFSVAVRMREVESIKDAGSRGVGLRVLIGRRAGSAYTSDFSADGIREMVDSALAIAAITGEDPHAGLPDPEELGSISGDLRLYSDDIALLETDHKVRQAREAEEAALAADPRVTNSEGASFDSHLGLHAFANSHGFAGSYRTSSCSISAVPVAKQADSMERDYWFSLARSADRLEPPDVIGRKAAERAVRRLGARKVQTQKVPVVFEPRTARSLLDNIFEAVTGDAIYRKASFLAGKLGEKVASEKITVIDDGTLPGLFGSSPYDDEGVPSRRTVIIDKGVLKSYLLNSYTARKLGLKTTGNAARGIAGNAGIGHGNLFLEKGDRTPGEILRLAGTGLYVTELMGFGVNIVTGDYSRGASGLWIENAELSHPVSEVTIAGNLRQMLFDIEAVASDLEFRGSTAAPTLMVREMTVSGN